MKIKVAHSTGRPEPQFIVEAETDEDRLFLKQFLTAQNHSESKLIFTLHGECWDMTGFTSFNFGWREEAKNWTPYNKIKCNNCEHQHEIALTIDMIDGFYCQNCNEFIDLKKRRNEHDTIQGAKPTRPRHSDQ